MKKALLVIDMQNVCVGEKHASYFKYDNKKLLREVNKAIDANENNLDLVITKEGMMPEFTIDGIEYRAVRIHGRYGMAIHAELINPEDYSPCGM